MGVFYHGNFYYNSNTTYLTDDQFLSNPRAGAALPPPSAEQPDPCNLHQQIKDRIKEYTDKYNQIRRSISIQTLSEPPTEQEPPSPQLTPKLCPTNCSDRGLTFKISI